MMLDQSNNKELSASVGRGSPNLSSLKSHKLSEAGLNIMSPKHHRPSLPPAGVRMRPPTGERNFNEIYVQNPEHLSIG